MAKMCSFDKLPDEILMKIISYLPFKSFTKSIPLVNKRFRQLSQESLLWTNLEIGGNFSEKDEQEYVDKICDDIFPKCPHLKSLTTKDTNNVLKIIGSAFRMCKEIHTLKLTSSSEHGSFLYHDILEAIGKNKKLRKLDLHMYKVIFIECDFCAPNCY